MQGAILEVDLERMERSILSDCLFVFAVIQNSRWRAQLHGALAKLKWGLRCLLNFSLINFYGKNEENLVQPEPKTFSRVTGARAYFLAGETSKNDRLETRVK